MNINIRWATADDCSRLLELIQELAVYERAPEAVTVTIEEFIDAGFGTSPVWKAFVATEENCIVGFALFYTRYSTWNGRRLYLEDFLVTEECRGKGVGKLLFDRVIAEANSGDYHGMVWQVLDWNEPAINFYKKYKADLDADWINGSLTEDKISEIV